jgi:hypothetical protein
MGGVNGVVSLFHTFPLCFLMLPYCFALEANHETRRTEPMSALVSQ